MQLLDVIEISRSKGSYFRRPNWSGDGWLTVHRDGSIQFAKSGLKWTPRSDDLIADDYIVQNPSRKIKMYQVIVKGKEGKFIALSELISEEEFRSKESEFYGHKEYTITIQE